MCKQTWTGESSLRRAMNSLTALIEEFEVFDEEFELVEWVVDAEWYSVN